MTILCPLILSQSGEAPIKLSKGKGLRYRKDAIRVGRFIARNPVDGSDLHINVTPERLERWAVAFSKMQDNGVKVDLTIDHKRGAQYKRGEVISLFRDGNTMRFDTDLTDSDSEKLIKRCPEVSIEIEADARDGLGNRYGEAITAITVCRQPVVPGQEPFQRIAASRGVEGARTADLPVVWFSADRQTSTGPSPLDTEDPPVRNNAMFNEEQLAQVRKHLSLAEDAKPDDIASKVLLSLAKVGDAEEATTKLTEAESKIVKLSQQVEDLEKKGKTLTLSRDVAGIMEEAVDTKLETLKSKGHITPSCAEKLAPLLKGGAVMLSREAAGDQAKTSRSMDILDALAENDPAKLETLSGERTGGQTVELSRQTDDGKNPLLADAKARADAAKQ